MSWAELFGIGAGLVGGIAGVTGLVVALKAARPPAPAGDWKAAQERAAEERRKRRDG